MTRRLAPSSPSVDTGKPNSLPDLLRIHVVWDACSKDGARIAERLSTHFDGLGMERDGVAYRVPVRFASAPWTPDSPLPRPIDLDRARHNAVILLQDEEMHAHRTYWDSWVSDLKAAIGGRGGQDVYAPFGSLTGEPELPSDQADRIQVERRKNWDKLPDEDSRDQRLLLLLLITIRSHLRALSGEVRREPLFVSHAKSDGDTTARAIVDFVRNTGDGVPLETFYDATELTPGDRYDKRFENEIGHCTLLAIVSDVYETRPWCVFELTAAKRARRPIVLADIGTGRTSRTYPYGANLPRVRVRPGPGTVWIVPLLVEAMSEGLRCDLFLRQAELACTDDSLLLPRPPELFDVVHRDAPLPGRIVYPDPPLGEIEDELMRRALAATSPDTEIFTLGEIT